MAKYDKMTSLKNPGRPVQVESAIRDGTGEIIDETYAKQPAVDNILELATPYSTSKIYNKGEIVLYEGSFYRCISSTSGVWSDESWEKLTFEWMMENADKNFVYHNDQGQDTWVIDHNLNKKPSVEIVADADGREVIGDIEYVNDNRIIIHFQGAFNGRAYLN